MTFLVTTNGPLEKRMRNIFGLTAGAWFAMLLAGCGLRTGPLSTPAVSRQPGDLRAAPTWVIDRMAQVAPDLYFSFNSHVLSKPDQRKLAEIAPALEDIFYDFPELVIVIEGHCDDRGLAEYNEQLGMERAEAVKRVLLNRGFPGDRLRTVSFSHRMPLCVTADDCRKKNRRVHFRAAQPAPARSRVNAAFHGRESGEIRPVNTNPR